MRFSVALADALRFTMADGRKSEGSLRTKVRVLLCLHLFYNYTIIAFRERTNSNCRGREIPYSFVDRLRYDAAFSAHTHRPRAIGLVNTDTIVSSRWPRFDFICLETRHSSTSFQSKCIHPEKVAPGYWFTAPYGDLRSRLPTSIYSPSQVGPHVYDGNGDLVWSGAHLFDDRPTFDFKVAQIHGVQHLTFITNEDLHETDSPGGSAIILDSSYQRVREVEDRAGRGTMNMHEYSTIEDGRRALTITFESKLADLKADGESRKMFIGNNGFSEVDTETGAPVFSWWALDHIDPAESLVEPPNGPGSYSSPWDAYHINSVDKNQDGDYLISARYTNTIYKISSKDGHVIWRFGGTQSDFKLRGFNMSSQHDARFQSDNDTMVIITFFNNHSDGNHATARTSAAAEVELDLLTMTARLVKQWDRPDGGLTKLRGNAQRLPNDNMFICWSENSYMSEHTSDGELVMEAQMASHRLVSYRAYKMNFAAQPSEPIAVKSFVFGVDEESSTTVVYVSWNGATEVRRWKFYDARDDNPELLGVADKTGFETVFMAAGTHSHIVVEALDGQGVSLGRSAVIGSELPASWEDNTSPAVLVASGHGELSGLHLVDPEEQASVPEDVSPRLHQQAANFETGVEQGLAEGGIDDTESIFVEPLFLCGVTAMGVVICGAIHLRRSRSRRFSGAGVAQYKILENQV